MLPIAGKFILFCWVVFVGYWAIAALSVKRTVSRRGIWAFWIGLLIGAGVVIAKHVPGLAATVYLPLWTTGLPLGLLADALALIGLGVMIWARVTIGRNWSGGVVLKENHELVTSGPYAFVRHPIYSGLFLLMLGTAVFWGVLGGFLGLAAFIILFLIKMRAEEKLMIATFPGVYPAYKQRVKALIPWLY